MAVINDRQVLIHLHSSDVKAPAAAKLNLGEIAVQYATEEAALYIKNNNNNIVKFIDLSGVTKAISAATVDMEGKINALDNTGETLASVDDNNIITLYKTITEESGIIDVDTADTNKITMAAVAKTGAAADVTIADAKKKITATNVEGALEELATAITTASLTIDGNKGAIKTGNGLNAVESDGGSLSVKTKDSDYVTVDKDGVQLDSTKIDSTYTTANTTNLATVATVGAAIETLDVDDITGFGTDKTLATLTETNGKISATFQDIAITHKAVTDWDSNVGVTEVGTGIANGTISVTTNGGEKTNVSVYGLGTAAYKAETDFASSAVVTTLIGTDVNKSVRTIATEELAAQLIAENADESLDTLKEIADWIQAHPGDAAAMNSAINSADTRLTALEGIDADTRLNALEAISGQSHTHDNKTVIDGITATKVSNWDEAYASAHTHANKTVLDGITEEQVSNWDDAEENAKAYASAYTDTQLESYATSADTHNAIQEVISNSVTNASGDTYVSATVEDHVVKVAATKSTITSLGLADTSLQGIVTGAEAGVTVSVDKKLDFSKLIIDCGTY